MKARDRAIQKSVIWLAAGLLVAASALAQQPAPTQVGKEAQLLLDTGQTAYEQGRYGDALRAYTKVYVLSTSAPKTAALAQLKIGSVYMAQRNFDAASASFQRALSIDPAYAPPRTARFLQPVRVGVAAQDDLERGSDESLGHRVADVPVAAEQQPVTRAHPPHVERVLRAPRKQPADPVHVPDVAEPSAACTRARSSGSATR